MRCGGPGLCSECTADASRARAALAQAEAERLEVVARVVHSNPIVLGQCGPLNANDELMTVAQHAASVARWAEMFNRVEQQRDAALARVAELVTALEPFAAVADAYDDSEDDDHEPYTDMGCDDRLRLTLGQHRAGRIALEGRTPQAQAQHSVPEGWKLVPVEPTEDVLEAIHNGGYVGDDQELRWFYQSILAAAPAPGGE